MITGIKSHPGRPPLVEDEEVVNLSFRCPASIADAIQAAATEVGCNKSEFIRLVLARETRRREPERRVARAASI